MLTKEQLDKLKEPLPACAISQHPTKKFLSTIKAIYVVERLNDVFGVGQWRTQTEFIEKVEKMVVVKSVFTVFDTNILLEAYGGNDNADLGDAYKGASTDALTKISSYLGIGMDVFKGLATNYQEKEEIKYEPIKEPVNTAENYFKPKDEPIVPSKKFVFTPKSDAGVRMMQGLNETAKQVISEGRTVSELDVSGIPF